MTWRGPSALRDGWTGVDLTGGYYDAGDNIKFGFPMAFTTTMLAWSIIEFGDSMPPSTLRDALVATRWGTDYLLKTVAHPDRIFVQVADPIGDHNCWERPEDMDTARTVYSVETTQPASDIAGETAAALSAASIAFRSSDPGYADTLLNSAFKVFKYADSYRGAYSDNSNARSGACPFYCDDSNGYHDELLWGAAWLWKATQNDYYLQYIQNNGQTISIGTNFEFGWANKNGGLNVLLSKEFLEGNKDSLASYKMWAENLMCTLIPESSSAHPEYTPGGLIYKSRSSNMQDVTCYTFLQLVYANYLSRSSQKVNCNGLIVDPSYLRQLAKRQVDYILGDNPMGMSYMVGYGSKYPQRVHHRGSSSPSIKDHPQFIACKDGGVYFNSLNPNPNVLVGAVVGGPGKDDVYTDDRTDAAKSEPTTYINAPFVGVLAYFAANPKPN
ncbi:hypothetical protein NE237_022080 [Protea cynaroides]|uniref:Endoglucanase n=1 Tax=Protea cynaroides TaxID=273540 RepID=A0A9Q0HBD0_9MAGN|nr:hypothetical protein NE237_022080 [Protea cynaroides]